jgi:spermidine synthase
VLSHSAPRRVDTIEIEPAIIAGALSFAPRVLRPYRDARSFLNIEDAKSYFARHGRRYDVILSEPSNPWVNGVATLFTTEFYRDTKRYLAPGGLFVQWIQHYEFNDRLLASVLAAMAENFADFEVYECSLGDLLIVAVAEGKVPLIGEMPKNEPIFLEQLKRVGITGREHLAVRRIGAKRELMQYLAPLAAPVNSDFYPFVQLEATRARFANRSATATLQLSLSPLPLNEMLARREPEYLREPPPTRGAKQLALQGQALDFQRILLDPAADPLDIEAPELRALLLTLKRPSALCNPAPSRYLLDQLHAAAELTLARLAPERRHPVWVEPRWTGCAPERISPQVRERLDVYRAIAVRDGARMLGLAGGMLDSQKIEGYAWARFLLTTAMLGAHASGNSAEATRLWNKHGPALYPDGLYPIEVVYVANWKG